VQPLVQKKTLPQALDWSWQQPAAPGGASPLDPDENMLGLKHKEIFHLTPGLCPWTPPGLCPSTSLPQTELTCALHTRPGSTIFKITVFSFVKFLRKGFVKKSSSLHIDRIGSQWPYTSSSKKAGYVSKINMEKRKGKSQCKKQVPNLFI
jgi:hypothetical protein